MIREGGETAAYSREGACAGCSLQTVLTLTNENVRLID